MELVFVIDSNFRVSLLFCLEEYVCIDFYFFLRFDFFGYFEELILFFFFLIVNYSIFVLFSCVFWKVIMF